MASDEIVRNLITREEVMGNLISTASSSVRSPLHDTLCSHVRTVIDSVEKKGASRKTIDVRRNITSDELQMLIGEYPEYSITSSACEAGTHNMAACFRFLETEYLLDMVPEKETFVYDIGGNWFSHMKFRASREIHCCCPILSLRDAERLETRVMSMQKYMRGSKDKGVSLFQRYNSVLKEQKFREEVLTSGTASPEFLDGEVFCENTFQTCVRRAPEGYLSTAIAVHSIYDINVEEFAIALKEKKIAQAYGCFLFPPGLLIGQKEGVLPAVNGRYKVENKKIKFFFDNDPNAGYEHDLVDYLKYIEKTYIEIPNGVFSIELTQMRGDTMFFKITDVTAACYHMRYRGMKVDQTFKCVPMKKNAAVAVPVFSWTKEKVKIETALVPRNLVEQGAAYAMKNKEKDLTVAVLKNYLSSVNNSYIFNGSQVREGVKVSPDVLSKLAVTLFLRERVYRMRENKIIDDFEKRILCDISLSGVFSGAIWVMTENLRKTWKSMKLEMATWFGVNVDLDTFDICDPVPYVEISDRYLIQVKGDIPISAFFDCSEACLAYEKKENDKLILAKSIVKKVTGDVYGENPTLPDTNALLQLPAPLRVFVVAHAVAAYTESRKRSRSVDGSSTSSTPRSLSFSSSSGASTSSTVEVESDVHPMWEVAHAENLRFLKIDGNMLKRTGLPSKPKPVRDYDMNARAEFLYYLLCSVISERAQMLDVVQSYRSALLFTEKVAAPLGSCIYSCKEKGGWLFREPRVSELGHKFAVHFDFKPDCDMEGIEDSLSYCELVELRWDRTERYLAKVPLFQQKTGYYLLCDATILCNNYLIYNNLVDTYNTVITKPLSFELIDGVPGCGKSSMILNQCDLRREVVVGEGRNATDDLRQRFVNEKRYPLKTANMKVRTLDSLLLTETGKAPKAKLFHFDEALKVHYGAILFCADKIQADKVIAQGDRAQLPMVNRVEGIELSYSTPDYSRVVISPKLQSYRIPGDVAYYLSSKGYYKVKGVPQTVTTKNKVARSMFARGENTEEKFISLQNLPIVAKNTHYLTFLQAEKETLISHLRTKGIPADRVSTVHEAQGGTYKNVILVRLQRTANEIYPGGVRSASYIVVAISRHTESFTYCSVVDDKLLLDIVDENGLKDVPIRKFSEHIVE
jgi:hypothetical protein